MDVPEQCGDCGRDTTHCDGHDKVRWWEPSVSIVSNGMLTAWTGTLPKDWFKFNGFVNIVEMSRFLGENCEMPLIGDKATVLWMFNEENFSKKVVVSGVEHIAKTVMSVRLGSLVVFVRHIPLEGAWKMEVIKYNNNLM